ncbi:MAG TPA: hypothetical protein VNF73_06610 [Candidatus Saccharimonadales bacterium]|nr:hypothetical protein [Candidatus Saccharimonadales bacterium]
MSLYNAQPSVRAEAFRLTVNTWSDRQGPIVCRTCGCRLEAVASWPGEGDSTPILRHFNGAPGRDARGCRIDCAQMDHDLDGLPLI